MKVSECVRLRRAIREFQQREVPEEVLREILEAGRLSPSAKNTQPWHFIIIRDPATLQKLTQCTPSGNHLTKAPVAIAVVMDNAKYPMLDGARVIQNMTLVAWEHGVGACWIANWDEAKAKEAIGVPAGMEFISIMPYGYPSEGPRVARSKERRGLGDMVHREKYGTPYY